MRETDVTRVAKRGDHSKHVQRTQFIRWSSSVLVVHCKQLVALNRLRSVAGLMAVSLTLAID